MSKKLKIRKIGNSLGVVLPKEVADRLRVGEDDTVHYVLDSDGLHLTAADPGFDPAMEAFSETRRKYRKSLHKLAT